jgi:hypothetical protein
MCIYVGSTINLNSLVYNPPRNGPTLWEIGIPDRSAGEFYVPNPYANLMNKLYMNDNKYRLVYKSVNISILAFTISILNYKTLLKFTLH